MAESRLDKKRRAVSDNSANRLSPQQPHARERRFADIFTRFTKRQKVIKKDASTNTSLDEKQPRPPPPLPPKQKQHYYVTLRPDVKAHIEHVYKEVSSKNMNVESSAWNASGVTNRGVKREENDEDSEEEYGYETVDRLWRTSAPWTNSHKRNESALSFGSFHIEPAGGLLSEVFLSEEWEKYLGKDQKPPPAPGVSTPEPLYETDSYLEDLEPDAETADEETADAETTPDAETADEETTPDAETADEETTPDAETTDAETMPDAETTPDEETADAETADAETMPDAETADAETTPGEETADAETTPDEETADAETTPDAETAEDAVADKSEEDETTIRKIMDTLKIIEEKEEAPKVSLEEPEPHFLPPKLSPSSSSAFDRIFRSSIFYKLPPPGKELPTDTPKSGARAFGKNKLRLRKSSAEEAQLQDTQKDLL